MPYIEALHRDELLDTSPREWRHHINGQASAGELNFAITNMVLGYLGEKPNYAAFNNAIGALECAKLELYRRMVAPYEDLKISLNGDVYPTEARARSDDGQTR